MKFFFPLLIFLCQFNLFAQELDVPDPRDAQNLEQEEAPVNQNSPTDTTNSDTSGKQEAILQNSSQGGNVLKVECTCPPQQQEDQPQSTESLFPEGSNILVSPMPENPTSQQEETPRKVELVSPQFKEPSGYSSDAYKQMPGMNPNN